MAEDEAEPRRERPADASDESIQPSDPRAVSLQVMSAAIQTSVLHAGPIPPPETLARYEEVLPGLADRIMTEAERQQAHRQEAEMALIKNDARESLIGIAVGGGVALAALAVAGIFAFQGHPWFGIGAVLGTVASLAGVFVYGTHTRRKERTARLEGMLNPTLDDPEEPATPPAEPQPPQA